MRHLLYVLLFDVVHWQKYDVSFLFIPLGSVISRGLWSSIECIGNWRGLLSILLGGGVRVECGGSGGVSGGLDVEG